MPWAKESDGTEGLVANQRMANLVSEAVTAICETEFEQEKLALPEKVLAHKNMYDRIVHFQSLEAEHELRLAGAKLLAQRQLLRQRGRAPISF